MSELEIPQAAFDVFNSAATASSEESGLANAAPLIVAAELRRMLNEDEWPCRCIRDRADKLDPEGFTRA
jgi:hypothetical protein